LAIVLPDMAGIIKNALRLWNFCVCCRGVVFILSLIFVNAFASTMGLPVICAEPRSAANSLYREIALVIIKLTIQVITDTSNIAS